MLNKSHTTLRFAYWDNASDNKMLSDIRRRVFIEEQKVPESLEWDEFDDSSSHFIVLYKHKAIAAARLKPDGQIGRMAVLPTCRNQGIGSDLLQFILNNIDRENLNQVYLHAQITAIKFYEKTGFISYGEIFYEANIPHRKMIKTL